MDTKPWWQSTTVWANVATVVIGYAVSMGFIPSAVGDAIINATPGTAQHLIGLVTTITGLLGIWGRVKATTKISVN
jgi:hypothetical protein